MRGVLFSRCACRLSVIGWLCGWLALGACSRDECSPDDSLGHCVDNVAYGCEQRAGVWYWLRQDCNDNPNTRVCSTIARNVVVENRTDAFCALSATPDPRCPMQPVSYFQKFCAEGRWHYCRESGHVFAISACDDGSSECCP